MRERTNKKYFKILAAVMFVVLLIFLMFGFFNYAVYGEEAMLKAPLVTLALPRGQLIIELAVLLYILNIIISFPLIIFPANKVIESYLFGEVGKTERTIA